MAQTKTAKKFKGVRREGGRPWGEAPSEQSRNDNAKSWRPLGLQYVSHKQAVRLHTGELGNFRFRGLNRRRVSRFPF
jgi:hypothetical protein